MVTKLTASTIAAAGFLSLGAGAFAAVISDPYIRVRATNGSGTGTFDVLIADTTPGPNGSFIYSLAAPVDIMSGPNVIATITQLNSTVRPLFGTQPNTITLSFTFLSGDTATRFEVDSTTLTFDPILDEAARATAGITITDSDNDGVTSTGNLAGGAHYAANYNGATNFANLLAGPFTAGNGQTVTMNDRSPNTGFTPLGGNADDMTARWDFTLSPMDQVGVTSSYFLVPAPGALALLGLAGVTLGRRNRR